MAETEREARQIIAMGREILESMPPPRQPDIPLETAKRLRADAELQEFDLRARIEVLAPGAPEGRQLRRRAALLHDRADALAVLVNSAMDTPKDYRYSLADIHVSAQLAALDAFGRAAERFDELDRHVKNAATPSAVVMDERLEARLKLDAARAVLAETSGKVASVAAYYKTTVPEMQ